MENEITCQHCGAHLFDGPVFEKDQFSCVRCHILEDEREREFSIVESDEVMTYSGEGYAVAEKESSSRSLLYVRGLESRREGERWVEVLQDRLTRALSLTLNTGDKEVPLIICGRSTAECERIFSALDNSVLQPYIGNHDILPLWELEPSAYSRRLIDYSDWAIPRIRHANPIRFEEKTFGLVVRGDDFRPDDSRIQFDPIIEALQEEAGERADLDAVGTLSEARDVGKNLFPTASKVIPQIERALVEYLRKNPEHLNPRSRRTIAGNQNGQNFEDYFEQMAQDSGLEVVDGPETLWAFIDVNPSNARWEFDYEALCEAVPSALEAIFDGHSKHTPPAGIPDFFVYGEQADVEAFLSGLDDEDVTLSHQGAYVEVKYTDSKSGRAHIPNSQRELIPQLTEAGADVFFFKGTPEDEELRRSWLKPRN
ncbi:hypothetical protein [Haladaptatus sp. T7]|uniref:hypothetical protein n=1 Tax=Haladaptatus sp. T7 TaxID=2029368 RepID=UPI00222E362B|nr:hypothetical protein [Haladaptatus sp. T7]